MGHSLANMSPKLFALCGLCVVALLAILVESDDVNPDACQANGKTYQFGDIFKIGCRYCRCEVHGRTRCASDCAHSAKRSTGCKYLGKWRRNKNKFRVGCNICKCWFGEVACYRTYLGGCRG